jgi:outer membrane protein TolC
MIGAEKQVMLATSKVKELTASLNDLLGLPEETKLELVPPEPLTEDTSMDDAIDKAVAANVAVVEAEQTAVKARAGSALSKMLNLSRRKWKQKCIVLSLSIVRHTPG